MSLMLSFFSVSTSLLFRQLSIVPLLAVVRQCLVERVGLELAYASPRQLERPEQVAEERAREAVAADAALDLILDAVRVAVPLAQTRRLLDPLIDREPQELNQLLLRPQVPTLGNPDERNANWITDQPILFVSWRDEHVQFFLKRLRCPLHFLNIPVQPNLLRPALHPALLEVPAEPAHEHIPVDVAEPSPQVSRDVAVHRGRGGFDPRAGERGRLVALERCL